MYSNKSINQPIKSFQIQTTANRVNENKGALSSKVKWNKLINGFPTISDRCANEVISQSVSLAHAASGEHLVNGHVRRHARKYVCQYTASTQPQFKKKCHVSFSVANVPKREEEREEMLAEWLARPHLPFPNLLAPQTCLCTVTVVTVLDGALNKLPLEGWWGRRGWERNKQHLTQVAKKTLQSFHCTNALFRLSLAGFLKHNSDHFFWTSRLHPSFASLQR